MIALRVIWGSLPGVNYSGQHMHTVDDLLAHYWLQAGCLHDDPLRESRRHHAADCPDAWRAVRHL